MAALLLRMSTGQELASLSTCDAPAFARYIAEARRGRPSAFDLGMSGARRRAMVGTLRRREALVLSLTPAESSDPSTVDPTALAMRCNLPGEGAQEEAAAAVVALVVMRRSAQLLAAARTSLQAALHAGGSALDGIDDLEVWSPLADWDLDTFLDYTAAVSAGEGPSLWEALAVASVRDAPLPPLPEAILSRVRAALLALSPRERARPLTLAPQQLARASARAGMAPAELVRVIRHLCDLKRRPFELATQLLDQSMVSDLDSADAGERGPSASLGGGVAPSEDGACPAVSLKPTWGLPPHHQAAAGGSGSSSGALAAAELPTARQSPNAPTGAMAAAPAHAHGATATAPPLPSLQQYAASLNAARAAATAATSASSSTNARSARLLMLKHRRMVDRLKAAERRQAEATVRGLANGGSPDCGPGSGAPSQSLGNIVQALADDPGLGLTEAQLRGIALRCQCSVQEVQQMLQAYATFCLLNEAL